MTRSKHYWCRICGEPVRERAVGVFVHAAKGADHGPIPTTRKPSVVA